MLKAAVPYELSCEYPDEAYAGEEFTISFSSTCGKIMVERAYLQGDPIYSGDIITGYEKVYTGLTCDMENLQWESLSGDDMVSCTGGTLTQTWEDVGTYVYRVKVSQKAYKNSDCPDCSTFKGVMFECFMVTVVEGSKGTFTDARDGHVYQWVKIGEQVWMAENLAFKTETGSWAYYEDESNVAVYGRLYDWATVMDGSASSSLSPSGVKGVCPEGWHLPSEGEWNQLAKYVSDQFGPYLNTGQLWENVGTHLKATGTIEEGTGLWKQSLNTALGSDDFGFSALPGGRRQPVIGYYSDLGNKGLWWTSSTFSFGSPKYADLSSSSTSFWIYGGDPGWGFSVRCVKD